jgi:hypothetical protein
MRRVGGVAGREDLADHRRAGDDQQDDQGADEDPAAP